MNVWPQKWNASDSPGAISVPTVRAAVRATRAPPTLARKPRRELSLARASENLSRCSGTDRRPPSLGCGQDALELRQVVERPLGEDSALRVERQRKWATGDLEAPPELRLGHFVEHRDGDVWVLGDVLYRGNERLADVTALRGEDGQLKVGARDTRGA